MKLLFDSKSAFAVDHGPVRCRWIGKSHGNLKGLYN